jgi:hypothetical protein
MKIFGIYNDSFFQKKPFYLPQKLWKVVCCRANPRPFEYMKSALESIYPEAEIMLLEDIPPALKKVILMYPDSIGLGQGSLESYLTKRGVELFILNGRKRHFELTSSVRRKLRLKRFLETSFLFEFLGLLFLLIFASLSTIKDKMMGRS